jgi:hypothetical protein
MEASNMAGHARLAEIQSAPLLLPPARLEGIETR